jgi:hypothetical protein
VVVSGLSISIRDKHPGSATLVFSQTKNLNGLYFYFIFNHSERL